MRGPHQQSHVTHRYSGHVTNKKRYISTFTRPMDLKLSRLVTQDEGIPPTKSRDTPITWSRDKSKTLYLHFHKAYGPQTQQDTGYSEVVKTEVCAEGNWIITVSAYFYPSFFFQFISILRCQKNMLYQMLKKRNHEVTRCNGKLVLAKNKNKNANQN